MAIDLAAESGARTLSIRFYCPEPPSEGRYRLRGDEARHLAKVSRHGPGDLVELFDGRGFAAHARVLKVGRDEVELAVEAPPLPIARAGCPITLATAIPKGDRFDWLVEKATELGATRLIPLITERSVVEPGPSKLDRLRRTIIESCKQCRRTDLMGLESPIAWSEFVNLPPNGGGVRWMALRSGLRPGHWPELAAGGEVRLAVGPEGGFTPEEIELAMRSGWHAVRLAPHVLRVEAAGISAISAVLARIQEDDGARVD